MLNNNIMKENILKHILEEIYRNERSLIVTLPSRIDWKEYEKELRKAANYKYVLNFKVGNFPKGIHKGDKCYVVHDGYIMGWMEITGFSEEPFKCSTTGKQWDGKFVQRSGPFHYLKERIPYKGFQGFRYFNLEEYKLQNNIE
jgi:hypothetical protein